VTCRRCAGRARSAISGYKDRISDIVNGIVKRVEYGTSWSISAAAKRSCAATKCCARGVPQRRPYPRLYLRRAAGAARTADFLSRTHPQFMAKLFAQEVPEIYDGIVEVKAVRPRPGSRAKIAGDFPRLVGRPGRRLRRHARLARAGGGQSCKARRSTSSRGRRTSRPSWSMRSLPPKSPRLVLDEERERIEVVVPDQQLSLAIGRRGQNVRLASSSPAGTSIS